MNNETLEARAADWLIRSEAPGFTAEDQMALDEWLAASPRHRAVYMRLHAAWRQGDKLRWARPIDGTVNPNLLADGGLAALKGAGRGERPAAARYAAAWKYAVAAVVVAAVLVGAVFATRAAMGRFAWQTYATDIGGFQRVMLRDGSAVQMNTDSRMRVRFTHGRRQIRLDRGEALFTVAKDARRPFDVEARGTTIRALGTAFSVRLGEARHVDVLVTEGRVAIDPPGPAEALVATQQAPTLSAGDAVTITPHGRRLARVSSGEVARNVAWTQGRLLFEQQTIAEMVAEFNRYNRRQLVVADPHIADLRMSAGFDATDPESFVTALKGYGVRALPSGTADFDPVLLVGGSQ